MVIFVSSLNQFLLSSFETNWTHWLCSFTRNIDVRHILIIMMTSQTPLVIRPSVMVLLLKLVVASALILARVIQLICGRNMWQDLVLTIWSWSVNFCCWVVQVDILIVVYLGVILMDRRLSLHILILILEVRKTWILTQLLHFGMVLLLLLLLVILLLILKIFLQVFFRSIVGEQFVLTADCRLL